MIVRAVRSFGEDVVDVGSGPRFVASVARANGFVEIAKLVCVEAKQLGADACIVSHHAATGQPVLAVDDIADQTSEVRLSWVGDGAWRRDPLHLAMLARHGSVVQVSQAGTVHTLLIPIIEPGGVLGSIRCISRRRLSCEVERELLTIAAIVAVRFVYLGITSLARDGIPRLTPRQRDVAELATRGLTNCEIGAELGISMNTVKNRLKEAFDRLAIRSRVELVAALTRTPVAVEVPFGVSRDGLFAIARARSGPARSGPGSRG